MQQRQECSDEFMEGTAVYTSVRTSEILKKEKYKSHLDLSKFPYYSGFQNADFFIEGYQKSLKAASENVYDAMGKCYEYGCYQALFLQKYFPGWQNAFAEEATNLYKKLTKHLPISEEELPAFQKRFEEIYGFKKIFVRCSEAIQKRDNAYKTLKNRKGMAYVINFKKIHQYADQLYEKTPHYMLGLIRMYMKGIPAAIIGNIEISAIKEPVEGNQLYHIKCVDTTWKSGDKPFTIEYEKQTENIYEDAVIQTPLFTLKAPLVRIEESSSRVKFILLPVVKKS